MSLPSRQNIGLVPMPDLPNMALDMLRVAVVHCDRDGQLHWHDKVSAAALLGLVMGAAMQPPSDFATLDDLAQGGLKQAWDKGVPVRCRMGRLFEIRANREDGIIMLRRLGQGAVDRRQGDADAVSIAQAIDDKRVTLFFQPIIDTATSNVHRWECLARLKDLDGSMISPAHFIPVAERAGLIGRLDLATLDLALDAVANAPSLQLAVNVSAATVADERACQTYVDRLSLSPNASQNITVEITETIAIEDLDVAARFARQMRQLGARVALDDFGEGHTSFRSLLKLPLDEVKIDGLYVESIHERAQSRAFVRAIDKLSRELGLETVAERVENAEEAAALNDIGVGMLQGYHFGRPSPDVPKASD